MQSVRDSIKTVPRPFTAVSLPKYLYTDVFCPLYYGNDTVRVKRVYTAILNGLDRHETHNT